MAAQSSGPLLLQIYWSLPVDPKVSDYGGAIPIAPILWFSTSDYLFVPALAQGSRGTVKLKFDISDTGFATNCLGEGTANNQKLADQVCRLMEKRARFITAKGANGPRPTKGVTLVNFM